MGDVNAVKALLSAGAYVNYQNERGETALMLAAANKHDDVLQFLLETGADKKILCARGRHALDYALESKNKFAAEILKSVRAQS